MIKIGICAAPQYWAEVKKIGYDYAEGYFRALALADDTEFEKMRRLQKEAELPVEAVNGIFGSEFRLYEDKTIAFQNYADKGFYRAKELGAKIAVFGSGAARAIPDGMEKAAAVERFVHILHLLGDLAKKNDMMLALEPLRYKETNFINTLTEGVELCKAVAHDNVGVTLDLFHFYSNGEALSTIPDAKSYLFHAHLARPNVDRKAPTEQDVEDCRIWADALRDIGYDARLSLEAVFGEDFLADAKRAYPIMQLFRS